MPNGARDVSSLIRVDIKNKNYSFFDKLLWVDNIEYGIIWYHIFSRRPIRSTTWCFND
jgi:hypothetical protein